MAVIKIKDFRCPSCSGTQLGLYIRPPVALDTDFGPVLSIAQAAKIQSLTGLRCSRCGEYFPYGVEFARDINREQILIGDDELQRWSRA